MNDFLADGDRIKFEDKASFRSVSFENQGAEDLGKKILTGELDLDSLLKCITDDEKSDLKKSILQGNVEMLCL